MPKTCRVCTHEKRGQIDTELVRGTPLRTLAKQFGTSSSALHRHKGAHIPEELRAAKAAGDADAAEKLLGQIADAVESGRRLLRRAEREGALGTAASALRAWTGALELTGKALSSRPAIPPGGLKVVIDVSRDDVPVTTAPLGRTPARRVFALPPPALQLLPGERIEGDELIIGDPDAGDG